jgi:hypothetical protein
MKRILLHVLLVILGLVALTILVFETVGPSVDTAADIDAAALNTPAQADLDGCAKKQFAPGFCRCNALAEAAIKPVPSQWLYLAARQQVLR